MLRFFSWDEIEVTHTKGSGPGGQNRNKRMTGVRVRHIPTGLTVLATERRSQLQNLHAALERLDAKLEQKFKIRLPRVPTQKTRASNRKRIESKKRRSQTKRLRQRGEGE